MDDIYHKFLDKIENYCAYQERCLADVKKKMAKLNVPVPYINPIIHSLIESKFIDEERFARAYVRSKLHFKKDGIEKLKFGLKTKRISAEIINQVLAELEADTYMENLKSLLEKKWRTLEVKNEKQEAKAKLIRYLMSKGYRYEEFKNLVSKI